VKFCFILAYVKTNFVLSKGKWYKIENLFLLTCWCFFWK